MSANLFRERAFADTIKDLEMRSCWITWWALNLMTSVLIKDRRGEDTECKGEGHVKTERLGVMQSQAKENLEPQEVARDRMTLP